MTDRTCSIGGCDGAGQLRRGMCEPHYRRWKRYGDPHGRAPQPDWTCAVPGCTIHEQTRQHMCEMHYRRWRRNGTAGQPGSLLIRGDDLTRFWSYVDDINGTPPKLVEWLGPCWLWTGCINDKGYGSVRLGRRSIGAHRLGYQLLVGPIPSGLDLDHLCRVTRCVRPGHLEPVTRSENSHRLQLARAGKPWLSPAPPSV